MECPDPSTIAEVMKAKGYVVFRDARGHDLNIVGIRTADMTANRFNEAMPSVRVDKWSAGCQVFQDPDQFQFFLTLCDQHKVHW